jgi:F-type H+-transporting ATPase subunit alpha
VAIIFAGSRNLLRKVPVNKIKEFERQYIDFLNAKHKKTMEAIKSGKLTQEIIDVLTKTAEELSSSY